jgi:hypothetical protein
VITFLIIRLNRRERIFFSSHLIFEKILLLTRTTLVYSLLI